MRERESLRVWDDNLQFYVVLRLEEIKERILRFGTRGRGRILGFESPQKNFKSKRKWVSSKKNLIPV